LTNSNQVKSRGVWQREHPPSRHQTQAPRSKRKTLKTASYRNSSCQRPDTRRGGELTGFEVPEGGRKVGEKEVARRRGTTGDPEKKHYLWSVPQGGKETLKVSKGAKEEKP